jgi:hypothetical protein
MASNTNGVGATRIAISFMFVRVQILISLDLPCLCSCISWLLINFSMSLRMNYSESSDSYDHPSGISHSCLCILEINSWMFCTEPQWREATANDYLYAAECHHATISCCLLLGPFLFLGSLAISLSVTTQPGAFCSYVHSPEDCSANVNCARPVHQSTMFLFCLYRWWNLCALLTGLVTVGHGISCHLLKLRIYLGFAIFCNW